MDIVDACDEVDADAAAARVARPTDRTRGSNVRLVRFRDRRRHRPSAAVGSEPVCRTGRIRARVGRFEHRQVDAGARVGRSVAERTRRADHAGQRPGDGDAAEELPAARLAQGSAVLSRSRARHFRCAPAGRARAGRSRRAHLAPGGGGALGPGAFQRRAPAPGHRPRAHPSAAGRHPGRCPVRTRRGLAAGPAGASAQRAARGHHHQPRPATGAGRLARSPARAATPCRRRRRSSRWPARRWRRQPNEIIREGPQGRQA